ncbi:hypothetical protein M4A92_15375 [Caldibacillus thermoamylovorans]|uniref:hypothetical protein n=1 Tax=Caldibacillus thermoamylovorans TaxID=35841 RepID=UPI00203B267F|nr:hypothetical protein [Caldibacillus thermoamylovorans]MCM3799975.1 hypothetical protein [Caldibacillus thermoamylovorans]
MLPEIDMAYSFFTQLYGLNRREGISSPKSGIFRLKKTTRRGLVAKKWGFPGKNDDEKRFRRQKMGFPVQKRRREGASSPKSGVSRAKVMTRRGFVAKKWRFPGKSDDEKGFRRQKVGFLGSKRRREGISSAKKGVSRAKVTTRKGLVSKNEHFPLRNGNEKRVLSPKTSATLPNLRQERVPLRHFFYPIHKNRVCKLCIPCYSECHKVIYVAL